MEADSAQALMDQDGPDTTVEEHQERPDTTVEESENSQSNEAMDCDNGKQLEEEDYDMKSPVSESKNEASSPSRNQEICGESHDNFGLSEASGIDICNQSTDIDDKMDALSDLKDSDFETSQPFSDSEDIKSEQPNESMENEEKDTTLVGQGTESDNELDLSGSPNKSPTGSPDMTCGTSTPPHDHRNELVETSVPSPQVVDDNADNAECSNLGGEDNTPHPESASSPQEDEDGIQTDNVVSSNEFIETDLNDVSSNEKITTNTDDVLSSNECEATDVGEVHDSSCSISQPEDNIQKNQVSSAKDTDDINSPENSDSEITSSREIIHDHQFSENSDLPVSEKEGESHDFVDTSNVEQSNILGPTSPVSEESNYDKDEQEEGKDTSGVIEAASPVSDETDSELDDKSQKEDNSALDPSSPVSDDNMSDSKNVGPASPVSDTSLKDSSAIQEGNSGSLMGPTSPVSDNSDTELPKSTGRKGVDLGPASPVSDTSDLDQVEEPQVKKTEVMIGPASPISSEEGEEGRDLSKYDLDGPASPPPSNQVGTRHGPLSPTSTVSEDGSFPDDEAPKSPGSSFPNKPVANGISSSDDHAAERLQKEYKDISDEEDSFSDDEQIPKQNVEKSAKPKTDKVRPHVSVTDDHGELDYMEDDDDDMVKDNHEKLEDGKEREENREKEDVS